MPTMPVFRAQNSFHQLSVRSTWKFPPLKKKKTAPKKPERFWDAIFQEEMDSASSKARWGFWGDLRKIPVIPVRFFKKHDPGIEEMCLDYFWCPKISLII